MKFQRLRPFSFACLSLVLAAPTAASAQNLLVNPAFTDGNSGFTSTYTYFTGSPLPEGRYVIAHSPREHHPLQADFGDHTTGTGLMMVVNGGTLPNVYDWPLWQETVSVSANTLYDFSAWTTTANSFDTSPGQLGVRINGETVVSSYTVPNPAANWQQFGGLWNSGASSSATIQIFSLNTAALGNDFVLDDLNFSTAVPEPTSMLALAAGIGVLIRRRRSRKAN